jgi:hypothetical protein
LVLHNPNIFIQFLLGFPFIHTQKYMHPQDASVANNSSAVYTVWSVMARLLRMGCTLYRGSYPDWSFGTRVTLLLRCSIYRMATIFQYVIRFYVIDIHYWLHPPVAPHVYMYVCSHT